MKILFSASGQPLNELRDRIFAEVEQAVPGAFVEIDAAKGQIAVEPPAGADPDATAETLRQRFLTLGIQATRLSEPSPQPPFGAYQPYSPPPIRMDGFRQPRTVRLSVFVISLICVALAVAVLAFSFSALLFGGSSLFGVGSTLGTGDQTGEDYAGKIAIVDYLFENYSLYDTNGELLLDEMLKAYAAATGDEYAAYYTAEEYAALMSEMGGNAVGVGITVTWDAETESIMIIQVMPESPAAVAGVCPGDRIVAIGSKAEGERVSDLGYHVAMQKMLGEAGTTATFVVARGSEEIEFAIVRAEFTVVSAKGWVSTTNPTVGIIRLSGFEGNTPAQFKAAMNSLIEKGCTRFVFDVRNNPGGEQKSVTAVLSYFLNENDTVLSIVEKDGTTTYYRAEPVTYTGRYADCSITKEEIGMYRGLPIVVLTNGYTASAAELFTAALSDYELATLVGETTYGKGVIQTIFDLSRLGYSGGVKLTVGYYAPPSGVNYDKIGISPDKGVALDPALAGKSIYLLSEAEDNQLSAAIAAVLESQA